MKEEILGEIVGNVIVVGIAYYVIDDVSIWEIVKVVMVGSVGWRIGSIPWKTYHRLTAHMHSLGHIHKTATQRQEQQSQPSSPDNHP